MTKIPGTFKRTPKAQLVRKAFRDNPDAIPHDIAKKYKVNMKNVYMYRDQVRKGMATANKPYAPTEPTVDVIHVDADATKDLISEMGAGEFSDLVYQITRGRGGERTPNPEPASEPTPCVDVDALLDNRAAKYGRFVDVAATAQGVVQLVGGSLVARGVGLENDEAMSLYMIATKLARIAHGDPHNADNWLDIAGYATLVAERLSGKEPR
jgi:hypothetical protein